MSLEVIQKKRSEKPEVRQAARDAAMREVKERAKKAKELGATEDSYSASGSLILSTDQEKLRLQTIYSTVQGNLKYNIIM